MLTSGACGEGGAGGVEVGVRARVRGGGWRRGQGRGRRRGRGRGRRQIRGRGRLRGCAESGGRRATAAARAKELDLGEVVMGKNEPRG